MTWDATHRFGTSPAPDGLALVHDFLSTAPVGFPPHGDLLADRESAQVWLDGALESWSAATGEDLEDAPVLGARDLAPLRRLRARLLASLDPAAASDDARAGAATISTKLSIGLDADGHLHVRGDGTGWRWVASLLLKETYDAHRSDIWRRLKACRNPHCRIVFYDRSKNGSRVWDDMTTCGNTAHLRDFRARRRGGRG